MATLREWLTEEGFDWEGGRVIWHDTGDNSTPGWCDAERALVVAKDHEILDREFDSGFGGPECPRFIAEDAVAIYFPSQYDGATSLVTVRKDLDHYLDHNNPTPYPGGG